MATAKSKATKSDVDPVTYEPPTITVRGEEYPLQRLSVRHSLKLAKILAAGVAVGGEIPRADNMTAERLGTMLAGTLTYAEEAVLDLIASVLGVTVDELTDPERFPMGTELQVIETLAEHEDLRSFFASGRSLLGKIRLPKGTKPTH